MNHDHQEVKVLQYIIPYICESKQVKYIHENVKILKNMLYLVISLLILCCNIKTTEKNHGPSTDIIRDISGSKELITIYILWLQVIQLNQKTF